MELPGVTDANALASRPRLCGFKELAIASRRRLRGDRSVGGRRSAMSSDWKTVPSGTADQLLYSTERGASRRGRHISDSRYVRGRRRRGRHPTRLDLGRHRRRGVGGRPPSESTGAARGHPDGPQARRQGEPSARPSPSRTVGRRCLCPGSGHRDDQAAGLGSAQDRLALARGLGATKPPPRARGGTAAVVRDVGACGGAGASAS